MLPFFKHGFCKSDSCEEEKIVKKELRGWGSQEDAPESSFITFTSDDGTVEGRIDCFALGASFYASVSDGAIVSTDETYEFTFKY